MSEVIKFIQQSLLPENLVLHGDPAFGPEANELKTNELKTNELKTTTGADAQEPLLALQPVGLQVSADGTRPILLFRDSQQGQVLAVNLHPLEAGFVVAASSGGTRSSVGSHGFVETLLASLKLKLSRAIFCQVRSGLLYLRIEFTGHPYLTEITLRAIDCLSLCLYLQVPFFAVPKIMTEARELVADQVQVQKLMMRNPEAFKNSSGYLM